MPPESGENLGILAFVFLQLAPIVSHLRVRWGLELEVRGEPKNRYPDLTVIREEHIEQLKRRNTIRLSMAPPILVIEAVSSGGENRERDYTDKRSQYQDRGIPEYWLIDPSQQIITVLQLEGNVYTEVGVLRRNDLIRSSEFPILMLTAEQVLRSGQ